jgi:hypothetical protein
MSTDDKLGPRFIDMYVMMRYTHQRVNKAILSETTQYTWQIEIEYSRKISELTINTLHSGNGNSQISE